MSALATTERAPTTPTPNKRLVALWLINAGTVAGCIYEQPVLAGAAAIATLCLVASYLHWKYRRILEPARRVAVAFCMGSGPMGEVARDLSEAVFRWDQGAKT